MKELILPREPIDHSACMSLFNSQSALEQLPFQANGDLQEHKTLTKDITAKPAERHQQITLGPIAEA